MYSRYGSTTCFGMVCCLLVSPTAEAQITETVQKLLPATVAVELKSERPSPDARELHAVL